MTPLPLHLLFFCLAINTVTEGRIVRSIIGQNVSFSMTLDNGDFIQIKHNDSAFATVWPDNNNRITIQQPNRVGVVICNKTWSSTVTVIINIMNVTTNDTGMYSAVRPLNPTDIKDSILLKTIGTDIYTTKATTLIEDTKETNHYTTLTLRKKEDTEGIYTYMTTATSSNVNVEDSPSERRVLYIIFGGMGGIIAAAFIAYLLHTKKICFRGVSGSNINTVPTSDGNENVQEVNQAECYWTIVSNAKDEMSTAIETGGELSRESPLVGPLLVPTSSESDESTRADDIYVSQERYRYSNPINSCTMEFNDYIHPIHSTPLNTYMLSEVKEFQVCNVNMSIRRDVKAISI